VSRVRFRWLLPVKWHRPRRVLAASSGPLSQRIKLRMPTAGADDLVQAGEVGVGADGAVETCRSLMVRRVVVTSNW
jgi:hypothetical protein